VCGCDQRTYDNECIAQEHGVSIDYNGKCNNGNDRDQNDVGQRCTSNNQCNNNSYCKPLFGECNTRTRDGFCTEIPYNKNECDDLSKDQVCDCDGNTQRNQCKAEYEEVGVKHYGSCGNDDDDNDDDNGNRDNRCDNNDDCEDDQFCNLPECGRNTNDQGRCIDGGQNRNGCSRNHDPVCGCDQRTYDNECIAQEHGVSIDYNGKCNNGNDRDQNDVGQRCTSNNQCNNNSYCKPLFGECNTRTRDGFCTEIPYNKSECDDLPKDQVCTCNGNTQKNQCKAEYKSEGVYHYGSC